MISPTPGRVVWYVPGASESADFADPSNGDPCAAIVARVWSDRMVNLAVFDANGKTHSRCSVKLLQDDDKPDYEGQPHAMWMPYQKGQAAKTEALEAKAAAAPRESSAQYMTAFWDQRHQMEEAAKNTPEKDKPQDMTE
jgi:hypothetical protein